MTLDYKAHPPYDMGIPYQQIAPQIAPLGDGYFAMIYEGTGQATGVPASTVTQPATLGPLREWFVEGSWVDHTLDTFVEGDKTLPESYISHWDRIRHDDVLQGVRWEVSSRRIHNGYGFGGNGVARREQYDSYAEGPRTGERVPGTVTTDLQPVTHYDPTATFAPNKTVVPFRVPAYHNGYFANKGLSGPLDGHNLGGSPPRQYRWYNSGALLFNVTLPVPLYQHSAKTFVLKTKSTGQLVHGGIYGPEVWDTSFPYTIGDPSTSGQGYDPHPEQQRDSSGYQTFRVTLEPGMTEVNFTLVINLELFDPTTASLTTISDIKVFQEIQILGGTIPAPGVTAKLFRANDDGTISSVGGEVPGPGYFRQDIVTQPNGIRTGGVGERLNEIYSVSDLTPSKVIVGLYATEFSDPNSVYSGADVLDAAVLERVGTSLIWGPPARAYTESRTDPFGSADVQDPAGTPRYWFGYAFCEALSATKAAWVTQFDSNSSADITSSVGVRGLRITGRTITVGEPFRLLRKEPTQVPGSNRNFQMTPTGRRVDGSRLLVYVMPWTYTNFQMYLVEVNDSLGVRLVSRAPVPGSRQDEYSQLVPVGGGEFHFGSTVQNSPRVRGLWRVKVDGDTVKASGPLFYNGLPDSSQYTRFGGSGPIMPAADKHVLLAASTERMSTNLDTIEIGSVEHRDDGTLEITKLLSVPQSSDLDSNYTNIEVVTDKLAIVSHARGYFDGQRTIAQVIEFSLGKVEEPESLPDPPPFIPDYDLAGRNGPDDAHFVRSPK